MKRLLRFLFASLIFLSVLTYSQSPVIQSIIEQTNIDSLMYRVQELSGEVETIINGTPYTITTRNKFQPGNDMAANYIQQKLQSYGLMVYNQSFSSTGRNVYAVQQGSVYTNQYYIICAHYDDMPSGGLAPGADDNGSGTAAVLEAARIFTQFEPEYTIIYALWDEEEQGLVGSAYYALQAFNNGDSILGVINMDMIAYDSNDDNVAEIHTKPIANSVALANQMVSINSTYSIGATLNICNPGTTASDHASFWNRGYSAILLIESYFGGDFNAYYHTINDLMIHYNTEYYLKLSKLSFATVATLANMEEIVPVELVSFFATLNNNSILLEWTTASELNNKGFEIERSVDSKVFQQIGFVQGNGTTSESNNYTFSDNISLINSNILQYRLKQIDYDGTIEYSKVLNVEINSPVEFSLSQNYPNPFNPMTKIQFQLAKDSYTMLRVYDYLGREVSTVVNEFKPAGTYEYNFDASFLPSGTYFYTLNTNGFTFTKKMLLIK
jgi:Peptidase family M28/Secretion system C-terminal sorting domain